MDTAPVADSENEVAGLYQDTTVAEAYVGQRFQWSWNRMLHDFQVSIVDRWLASYGTDVVLELAPGPARIAVDLKNVTRGVMVDRSPQMLEVASRRLGESGKLADWTIREGNAFELVDSTRERFKLAYTFRFIRHFKLPDRLRIYQSIRSILLDDGILIFDVVGKKMRDRIDSQLTPAEVERIKGRLSVYDVSYLPSEFCDEMTDHGFEVVEMKPIVAHYFWQSKLSHRFDKKLPGFAKRLVRAAEKIPSKQPLEWVAVCRKS